jgi:hypothetical protein
MKTRIRFEGTERTWTYDEVDCPPLPEGTPVSCKHVAAARVVSQFVHFNEDETVEQWLVAK